METKNFTSTDVEKYFPTEAKWLCDFQCKLRVQ